MGGGVEQALVLVLAAQVHGRAHELGELAHARHAPVHLDATAPGGLDAAGDDVAVGVVGAAVDAPLNDEGGRPLADGRAVGALADEELEGAEEGRLAGAGLAGEHCEALRRPHRGLADQGDVAGAQLVDHRRPASP